MILYSRHDSFIVTAEDAALLHGRLGLQCSQGLVGQRHHSLLQVLRNLLISYGLFINRSRHSSRVVETCVSRLAYGALNYATSQGALGRRSRRGDEPCKGASDWLGTI